MGSSGGDRAETGVQSQVGVGSGGMTGSQGIAGIGKRKARVAGWLRRPPAGPQMRPLLFALPETTHPTILFFLIPHPAVLWYDPRMFCDHSPRPGTRLVMPDGRLIRWCEGCKRVIQWLKS